LTDAVAGQSTSARHSPGTASDDPRTNNTESIKQTSDEAEFISVAVLQWS